MAAPAAPPAGPPMKAPRPGPTMDPPRPLPRTTLPPALRLGLAVQGPHEIGRRLGGLRIPQDLADCLSRLGAEKFGGGGLLQRILRRLVAPHDMLEGTLLVGRIGEMAPGRRVDLIQLR